VSDDLNYDDIWHWDTADHVMVIRAHRAKIADLEADRDRMRRDLVESERVSEQRHESAVRWMNDANRSRRILADIDAATARAERAESERDALRKRVAELEAERDDAMRSECQSVGDMAAMDVGQPWEYAERVWGPDVAARLYPRDDE